MNSRRLALLTALWIALGAFAARAQTIIIANSNVMASELSRIDIKDVFTGAATALPDGSQVVPILLKGGTAHEEFLKAYVGKKETVFRPGWRALVFSGQAVLAKSRADDAEIVAFVRRTAGSIGYIDQASPHDGLKILTVK